MAGKKRKSNPAVITRPCCGAVASTRQLYVGPFTFRHLAGCRRG